MNKPAANPSVVAEKPSTLRCAGFFVLRSPLLASTEFTGGDPLDAFDDPIVREAIFRASPTLAEMATDPQRMTAAARMSIERYLSRMRRRATPFSLMAGYSFGEAGGASVPIVLPARQRWRRIVRVDVDCTTAIVQSSLVDHALREKTHWFRRNDLNILPDLVRVVVRDIYKRDSLVLADVVRSAALDHAFSLAENAVSFEDLADGLLQFSASREQARSYVHALIDRGLLVPREMPSIAADDVLVTLLPLQRGIAAAAQEVHSTSLGEPVDRQVQLLSTAIANAQQSDRPDNLIFDLLKPLDSGVVGDDVVAEAVSVLRVLQRTTTPARDARLEEFSEEFLQLYDMREVPLVEALDESRGYNFPAEPRYRPSDSKLARWTFSLFERACREGKTEIILQDSDIPAEVLWQPNGSFSMVFNLARDPLCIFEPRIDAGPGTGLFARATAFDPRLKEATRTMLCEVASLYPDVDMAEIVQFLPGKFAAFGQIPRLMPFELSLAARPADAPTSIDVNDLLLSYAGEGEFMLRSRRTGRRVLPMATGAANFNRRDNTSLGRFIGAIAHQRKMGLGWSWNGLENSSWLPRIRYRSHVLSAQTWILRTEDTRPLLAASDGFERSNAVDRLRADRHLPRHVSYRERDDHWLAVDLEDDWSIAAWLDIGKSEMTLAEQFPVERSFVTGANGPFHHEFVVPFVDHGPGTIARDHAGDKTTSAYRPAAPKPIVSIEETFDRVTPGGEVLYLTLMGDNRELLGITSELYYACIKPGTKSGLVDRWFFLPYSNPGAHIRLRCFGSAEGLYELLSAFNVILRPYVADRVLRSVSIDTYDRETYRYGGPYGLQLCEQFFQISSEFALEFHGRYDIQQDKDSRIIVPWVGSLRAILEATGIPLEEQRAISQLAASTYHRKIATAEGGESLTPPRIPKYRAGDIYREIKEELRQPARITPRHGWLIDRLGALFPLIREGIASGRIRRPFDSLLVDLLHVHSIRLLTTWARQVQVEEIVYHVLARSMTAELCAPATSAEPTNL